MPGLACRGGSYAMSRRRQRYSDEAVQAYAKRWKTPPLLVSIVYLVTAFVEILPGYHIPLWLKLVDAVLWSVFVVDYSHVCVDGVPQGDVDAGQSMEIIAPPGNHELVVYCEFRDWGASGGVTVYPNEPARCVVGVKALGGLSPDIT